MKKCLLTWFIVNLILGIIALIGLMVATTPVVNEVVANVWLGGMIFSAINIFIVFAIYISFYPTSDKLEYLQQLHV